MNRWMLLAGLTLLIILLAGGIGYYLTTPRLLEVHPPPGATNISAGSTLRLDFSRPMLEESITQRLTIQPQTSGRFSWEANTLVFTPEQTWPNGQNVHVSLTPGGRTSGWLTRSIHQEHSWSFTIAEPVLVYLYPNDAPAQLYSINPQTGEITQLTELQGEVLDFDVHPTGMAIFFSARLGQGSSAIYKYNRLDGETKTIVDCPQAVCRYPQISPSGEWLAYERTPLAVDVVPGKPQVWLLNLKTTDALPITLSSQLALLSGETEQTTQQPRWSSSGWLTCFSSSLYSIILYNPQTGESRSIPSQTGQPGDWDPQGKFFVFAEILYSLQDTGLAVDLSPIPFSHLLRYRLSDSSLQDLTQKDNLEDASPAFAPDGSSLAFTRKYLNSSQWTPGRQIWLMQPGGGNPHPITDDPQYNHFDLVWNPAGTMLAYMRFNQTEIIEPPEIWLMRVDGSQAFLLVRGGFAPQWMP